MRDAMLYTEIFKTEIRWSKFNPFWQDCDWTGCKKFTKTQDHNHSHKWLIISHLWSSAVICGYQYSNVCFTLEIHFIAIRVILLYVTTDNISTSRVWNVWSWKSLRFFRTMTMTTNDCTSAHLWSGYYQSCMVMHWVFGRIWIRPDKAI